MAPQFDGTIDEFAAQKGYPFQTERIGIADGVIFQEFARNRHSEDTIFAGRAYGMVVIANEDHLHIQRR